MEEFDYLNSNVSKAFNEKIRVRSEEMFEREVRERAQMLYNLRYSQEDAVTRIEDNLAWEFDDTWTQRAPSCQSRVSSLVAEIYGRLKGRPS